MGISNIVMLLLLLLGISMAGAGSFDHKLIFTERPRTAEKMTAGARTNSILVWDLFASHNKYGVVDYLFAGLPISEQITDRFSLLTYRSPAFSLNLMDKPYHVAGGAKLFNATFGLEDEMINDQSFVLFACQEGQLKPRQSLLLFSSWSFRSIKLTTGSRTEHTWYLVPGYELSLGKKKQWRLAIEYYLTNTKELPIKSFQFVYDEDQLDFYNPNRELVSYMVWGVTYARKHFQAGLHLLSHYTFQGLVFPLVGLGWQL